MADEKKPGVNPLAQATFWAGLATANRLMSKNGPKPIRAAGTIGMVTAGSLSLDAIQRGLNVPKRQDGPVNPFIESSLWAGLSVANRLMTRNGPRPMKVIGTVGMIAAGSLSLDALDRGLNPSKASPSKSASPAPSGPAGPISATGNSPGGEVPGQDNGPGILAKAAVTLATALPQTAPLVHAAKDPETAVRLGVGALGTATTVQAARMLSPAARVGAKFLTKAMLPLTAALAIKDGIDGYQKDGVKGAALGVADSLTGGLLSLGLEKAGVVQPAGQPVAPQTPQAVVSDRLDVARQAAERTSGEMGRTETLNKGSTAPANAEVTSDGMTDDYFRTQNGRQVRVTGYTTPGR